MRTLTQRLDDACVGENLEWLILPCDLGSSPGEARAGWRHGPYWCALLHPGVHPSGHGRFYAYNGLVKGREDDPAPEVVYIHPGPLGRHEAQRLLLAQLTGAE